MATQSPDTTLSPEAQEAARVAAERVQRLAQAEHFSSILDLKAFMLTRDDGSLITPRSVDPREMLLGEDVRWKVEYQRTLQKRAKEVRRLLDEASLSFALADRPALQSLQAHIERLQQECRAQLAQARAVQAATLEALESRPWWRFLGRNKRERAGEALGLLLKSPAQLQQLALLRRAEMDEAVLHGLVQMLAAAATRLEQREHQAQTLRLVIARVLDTLADRKQEQETAAGQSMLPNDLPPGYLGHLSEALAAEDEDMARGWTVELLRELLTELEKAGEELTEERLLERLDERAELSEPQASTLAAALTRLDTARGIDPRVRWRQLTGRLGGAAFAATPAVALRRSAVKEGERFSYQVLPAGQAPALKAVDTELRLASFEDAQPAARLGIAQVWTNFPLAAVAAVEELRPELERVVAQTNPFLLPERAAQAVPAQATKPETPVTPDASAAPRPDDTPQPPQAESQPGPFEGRRSGNGAYPQAASAA